MKKEMVDGIKIQFNKENNNYFEAEYNNDIDANILIISLLETINDICEDYNLNTNEQLKAYIKMGSIDNYTSNYEKDLMKELKTYED